MRDDQPNSDVRHTATRIDSTRCRSSNESSWQQRIAGSGLPPDIRAMVHQVVHGTHLRPAERNDVAEELIAHFEDGHEQGLSYSQIADEFGDPALAARLIRTSKLRSRPMWEKWYRLGMGASATGIAGYLGLALYFYSGKPRPSEDFLPELNAINQNVAESDKAWPIYRESWAKFEFCEGPRGHFPEIFVDGNGLPLSRLVLPSDGPAWTRAVDRLSESNELLDALRQGGRKPHFGLPLEVRIEDYAAEDRAALFPWFDGTPIESNPDGRWEEAMQGSLLTVLLPHIQTLRKAARILTVDARWAWTQGDAERVTRNIEAIFGMARQALSQDILVSSLVGFAVFQIGCDLVEESLAEHGQELTPEQLRRIQVAADEVAIDTGLSTRGERLMLRDFVQRVFTDDGQGDGHLVPGGVELIQSLVRSDSDETQPGSGWSARFTRFTRTVAAPTSMFTLASRRQCLEKADEVFARFDRCLYSPLHQDACAQLLDEVQMLDEYPLLQELFPALLSLRHAMYRTIGNQRGTVTGVALLRFQREHHRWPRALGELVPEFLSEIPADPISGDPLQFLPAKGGREGQPDPGPTLYSVGVDRDDDRGAPTRINADGSIPPPTAPVGDRPVPASEYRLTLPTYLDGDWIVWPRRLSEESEFSDNTDPK